MDLAELKRDWLQAKAASVDEVDHRVADGALWLISEIESLRQQLADKDEQICGMTEMAKSSSPPWYKVEEIKEWMDREGMCRINHIAPWIAEHLQKAFEKGWSMLGGRILFPIPGCPHKEEVERLNTQDSEVKSAIKVLLRTHMRLDHEGIPIIQMGATPLDLDGQFYTHAWLLLWEKYGPQAKALAKESSWGSRDVKEQIKEDVLQDQFEDKETQ